MEEYKIETRIRQIVYELSQPSLNRMTQCLARLDETDKRIEDCISLIAKAEQVENVFQNHAKPKFVDLENVIQVVKRLEGDFLKNMNAINQQLIQVRSTTDQLKLTQNNYSEHQQYIISAQIKLQQEIEMCNKKQAESNEVFNKKIEEFFRDYYTFFVECRNQVSQINKEYILLNKELKASQTIIDELSKQKEYQLQLNLGVNSRLEMIATEMIECVHRDVFLQKFQQEEEKRIQDISQIKRTTNQFLVETQQHLVSYDERMKGLENYELQYRNQLSMFEGNLNAHIEHSEEIITQNAVQLQKLSQIVKQLTEQSQKLEASLKEEINFTTSTLQARMKKEFSAIQAQFDKFKDESLQSMKRDVAWSLEEMRNQIVQEGLAKTEKALIQFRNEIKSQIERPEIVSRETQTDAMMGDVTGAIAFQLTEGAIEDTIRSSTAIQQFLIDLISTQVSPGSSVMPLKRREPKSRSFVGKQIQEGEDTEQRLQTIRPQPVPQGKSSILQMTGQFTDLMEIIQDQMEDLKADVQLINELREELDEKLRVFEAEFTLGMQKVEKNHSTLLKLQSDNFNNNEYILSKLNSFAREKEIQLKKTQQLSYLIAANSETNFVILSYLLTKLKDTCRFTLSGEMVLEQRPDGHSYRGSTYTLEDLLKKSFQALVESWDRTEILECKEQNPNYYYQRGFVKTSKHSARKQSYTLDRTLDKSVDRTIKCTTQTIVDVMDDLRKSARAKVNNSMHNGREPKKPKPNLTVKQILKQSKNSDSVEQLPKLK